MRQQQHRQRQQQRQPPGLCFSFLHLPFEIIHHFISYLRLFTPRPSFPLILFLLLTPSFLPAFLSAGSAAAGLFWYSGSAGPGRPLSCSAGFVITNSLRMTVSGVEAPFHPGLVGEDACQISSVSGNYLSPRLQFTILYLVA